MTPAEQAITLTENATATGLPKWRWLPGMLDAVDGARLVSTLCRGEQVGLLYAWAGPAQFRPSLAHLNEGHIWLPDFADPTGATQGCLAKLLRAAWGPDVTIEERTCHARLIRCCTEIFDCDGRVLFRTAGTLAECRVAALAAAPSEPKDHPS